MDIQLSTLDSTIRSHGQVGIPTRSIATRNPESRSLKSEVHQQDTACRTSAFKIVAPPKLAERSIVPPPPPTAKVFKSKAWRLRKAMQSPTGSINVYHHRKENNLVQRVRRMDQSENLDATFHDPCLRTLRSRLSQHLLDLICPSALRVRRQTHADIRRAITSFCLTVSLTIIATTLVLWTSVAISLMRKASQAELIDRSLAVFVCLTVFVFVLTCGTSMAWAIRHFRTRIALSSRIRVNRQLALGQQHANAIARNEPNRQINLTESNASSEYA